MQPPAVRGLRVQSFPRANPDTKGSFYHNAHFPGTLLQSSVEAVEIRNNHLTPNPLDHITHECHDEFVDAQFT